MQTSVLAELKPNRYEHQLEYFMSLDLILYIKVAQKTAISVKNSITKGKRKIKWTIYFVHLPIQQL